jgi:hypothetical protein
MNYFKTNHFYLTLCLALFHVASFGVNLIPNGNLQGGDPFVNGTATSNFLLACAPSSNHAGYYCYGDLMSDKHALFPGVTDHTLGTTAGRMLIFDGSESSGQTVWRQNNINMYSATTYTFTFWGHNRFASDTLNDVIIDLYVNTTAVQSFTILASPNWQSFSTQLSGYGPNTDIYLVQRHGGPARDFAIDDLSLETDPCLLTNGDFQSGDPIFNGSVSSDFDLACVPTFKDEGYYCWGTRMSDKNWRFPEEVRDHTYGNDAGRMLIFDGFLFEAGKTIWRVDNVNMVSTTSYIFTFWGHNRFETGSANIPIDLYVNTSFVQSFTIQTTPHWQAFSKALTGYGPNTSIYLVQRSAGKNRDFAIDDISLCEGYIETEEMVTGLSDESETPENQMYIQPNPADEHVDLVFEAGFNAEMVEIIDLNGKVVLKNQITNKSKVRLDVSHLKAGMYFVQTGNGKAVKSFKLIKK